MQQKIIAIFCLISLARCSGGRRDLGESAPKSQMYATLAAENKYQNIEGYPALFAKSSDADKDEEIKNLSDIAANGSNLTTSIDEDLRDAEIDGDLYLQRFHRHPRRLALIDATAPISLSQLREIANCPVPRLSLGGEVITTNAEWFIFVFCELDLLKRNELGNVMHYPGIPAMKHNASAYNFMRHALHRFFKKYLFRQPSISVEQKIALFERIFLVTQFRLMTTDEKTAVSALITSRGLLFTSRLYLANWRHSYFYADHFDFSVDQQPAYASHEAFGFIKDEQNSPLSGVAYKVASPYVGFTLSGVSSAKGSSRLELADCYDDRRSGTFSYNFRLQYYVPTRHEVSGHRHRHHCKNQTEHSLAISTNAPGYHQGFTTIKSREKCNRNLTVLLVPTSVKVKRPQTWPDINFVANTNLDRLSWQVNANVGKIGQCKIPKLIDGQVFDGFQWQDFINCTLRVDLATISPIGKYWPLTGARSAFDLMFQAKQVFLNGELALTLSELQIVDAIYQNLTFTSLSITDRQNIGAAFSTLGFEDTVDLLLATWYRKIAQTYFGFSKKKEAATLGKTYNVLKGVVRNINSQPIPGASVRIINNDLTLGSPIFTDTNGTYEIGATSLVNASNILIQASIEAEGYAPEQVAVPVRATDVPITTILKSINSISAAAGGHIRSPNGSVSFDVTPSAVGGPQSFTATDLQETEISQFPGATAASFEVNPSYQFNRRIQIYVAIGAALKAKVPAGDGWILMTQVGNEWRLIPSTYYPKADVIAASVDHFSRFVIVLSSQTICYNITNTDISVCLPISANLDHHPASTIFDRRVVNSTYEVPGIIANIKQRLVVGGWKADDIAVLDDPDTYKNVDLPTSCGNSSCPPISDNLPFDFALSPREGVAIGSITGSVAFTTNARVTTQAEQCAINPQASLPQLKLNAVNATDINLSATVNLNDVSVTYPCVEVDHRCIDLAIGTYCYDWPVMGSCSDRFNGNAFLTIQGFNQGYARNLDTPIKWKLVGTFNTGNPYVEVSKPVLVPRPIEICADLLPECLRDESNYRIQDELIRQYREKVTNELQSYALRKITEKIKDRLDRVIDPKFDETNCFGQELPDATSGISAGLFHSCTTVDGAAKCWGYNSYGQLGNNTFTNSMLPVQVTGLTSNVTAISSSSYHTCAIVSGSAKCWGSNTAGQLGNNSTIYSPVPVQVEGLTSGVQAISAGYEHTCAIVNGAVTCWGNNLNGELGNGTVIPSRVPTQVTQLLSGATAINAAGLSSCAVASGAGYCWGANSIGQLGNNSTIESTIPIQVSGLDSGVTSIKTSSGNYSCAIQQGAVKCWGYNAKGMLGNPVFHRSLVPVPVTGLNASITQITTGASHACGLLNGGAYCWGAAPEIGDNYRIPGKDFTFVPAVVPGMEANVSEISAGGMHTCATVGPSVWCWGYNLAGQLGNNTTINTQLPGPVVGLR